MKIVKSLVFMSIVSCAGAAWGMDLSLLSLEGATTTLPLTHEASLSPRVLSLFNYLKEPVLPEKVAQLAQKGFDNYQQAPLKSELASVSWDSTGGGKTHNWIFKTFGQSEEALIEELKVIEGPMTWTIGEIDEAYKMIMPKQDVLKSAIIYLVEKVGVTGIHKTPLGKGACQQLASQYNFRESQTENNATVHSYRWDYTQGPLGSIEAAAAALHRTAASEVGKLPHALSHVLPGDHDYYYKNGYLMAGKLSEAEQKDLLEVITKNINKLKVLPQWVMCESSRVYQLQIFSAAPYFQRARKNPAADIYGAQICNLLVAAQYEAIAKIAAIRAYLTDTSIPLHLTMVGQGVFKNPPEVMTQSFERLAEICKYHPGVHVYTHVFSGDDKNLFERVTKELVDKEKIIIKPMSREEFKNFSHP